MSFQFERFEAVAGIEPERALNISMGVAQAPLWAAFYASAGLGAAWWWSTAWARGASSFDVARLLAPEPVTPAEAYLEALDDAVCDLIETSQDEADETAEVVEAVQESAEAAAGAVDETAADIAAEAVAAEPVAQVIPEPLLEAVAEEQGTEAAVEPLSYAADIEAPVVELVTLEPTAQAPALEAALGETPKVSKKKSPKTSS